MSITYKLTPAPIYLSGDVRRKLESAQAAAAQDSRFQTNVEQLLAVQPPMIGLADIEIGFNALWIPIDLLETFIWEKLSVTVSVDRCSIASATAIEIVRGGKSYENTTQYGIRWEDQKPDKNGRLQAVECSLTGVELIEMSANFKHPKITQNTPTGRQINPALTAGARQIQMNLEVAWREWLNADSERRWKLEEIYNQRYNAFKLVDWSGEHLTLPGMSETWRRRMRLCQLGAIYQGTLGNVGVFHGVGLGKTVIGAAIAMERKRLDPTTKTVIVVKKSTLLQYPQKFRAAYPNANLLVATMDDCNAGNRQLFLARAATGSYDAIVMTHQTFEKIAVKTETLVRVIEERLGLIQRAMEAHEERRKQEGKRGRKTAVMKALERKRNRLEAKLEWAQSKKDVGLTFEDLGINLIIADEADVYINGDIETKLTDVKGLNFSDCAIADDFQLKCDILREKYGSGRIVLMTGTFYRNGLADLYVMQRLLQADLLKDCGINCFDDWLSLFGKVQTAPEIGITGQIAMTSRLNEFTNLPELMQMFTQTANIKRYEQVAGADMKRPTPRYVDVACPMSDYQLSYMEALVRRADAAKRGNPAVMGTRRLPDGTIVDKLDCLFLISTDGRKVSLHEAMVQHNHPIGRDAGSKLRQCAENVFRHWQETHADLGTQLIFLDLGTPGGKSFDAYKDLKMQLMVMGIPADQIQFMQSYKTDDDKSALFARVNAGEVRVLIGSTETMGIGVDVQDRICAMHHLDCPWNPAKLEQREGRGIRSGNRFDIVSIYRYVTQGRSGAGTHNCGFDSFMWQVVQNKLHILKRLLQGDPKIRRLSEQEDAPVFSASEIKALATGDPRIMQYVALEDELAQAERLYSSVQNDLNMLEDGRDGITFVTAKMKRDEEKLAEYTADYEYVVEREQHQAKIVILGNEYYDPKAAAIALAKNCVKPLSESEENPQWRKVGDYQGFKILVYAAKGYSSQVYLESPTGNSYEVGFYETPEIMARHMKEAFLYVKGLYKTYSGFLTSSRETLDKLKADQKRKTEELRSMQLSLQKLRLRKEQMEELLGLNSERNAA
jgi:N12 class adenine-specific DNA methylase